jgi:soluble lytic murein transglycosylase
MKLILAFALALLPAVAGATGPASPLIMQDVHRYRFGDAMALAQATGDPLVVKLVTFFRLVDPRGGGAGEIQAFIAANPDWPEQAVLAQREAEAAGLYGGSPRVTTPPFLAQVEAMHAAKDDAAAASLWLAQGGVAAAAADPAQATLFWPDQNSLARDLLAAGDAKDAYAVVTAVTPPSAGDTGRQQTVEHDFLAGFLLLRGLDDRAGAATWFEKLAADSPAVITQARAWYWLGRTQPGRRALADYARAAEYPDTYYGQLAALAMGETPEQLAQQILKAGEPEYQPKDVLNLAEMELPRAAALLVQMNDRADAAIFLNRLGVVAPDDRTRELAAKLAIGLGVPESAIAISRTAGMQGQMLVREGWPVPVTPPRNGLDPAISYAIMRAESSFNPDVISPAGAVGLMQLEPATARRLGRQHRLPYGNLLDPAQNMALGNLFLAELINGSQNCLPLAFAAYNGGPTNVARWIAANGDPELGNAAGGADIIDWVEKIPFSETRNYVERVTESVVIYRALLTGVADDPLASWMGS